jgi:RNA polymerase sigma-70 factor (ECF subfamily)
MLADVGTTSIDVSKIQKGNWEEFQKFYECYVSSVYRYALAKVKNIEDAEEIVQEVFTAVWKQRQSIHSENIIWKIVSHRCYDYWREKDRKNKYQLLDEEILETCILSQSQSENMDLLSEEKEKILAQFSKNQVEILQMLAAGWKRKEIAKKLQIPLGTIDSRIHRMLNKITYHH